MATKSTPKTADNGSKHIVVIGASAGGNKAILQLAGQLHKSNAAFFIVIHITNTEANRLFADRLQQATSLPCHIATSNTSIQMGHIYLAPADSHMLIKKDKVMLGHGPPENRHRPSIDVLFRSAAAAWDSAVTGIILTGLLTDGVAGMSAIHRSGGACIVQNPEEAEYPDMPKAVLKVLQPDYCITINKMGTALNNIIKNEKTVNTSDIPADVKAEARLVLDKDLRVKTANHAFYQTFKVKKEDTEGRFIYELGNRQWDIPQLRELLETIIPQNGQFHGYEVTHRFPGIGKKIMVLNARKIVQNIHRQQLILLAIEDITEHKLAEEVLAEREAWIRNMADNAPVMIWVVEADKRVTFFNKTWLEFTGRKPEQEMGMGWVNGIHPDDRAIFLQQYNAHFNERKPFSLEFRLLNQAGEYRWILNNGKPNFNSDENFNGYIVSCTEIHDKKLMQQELEKHVQERTHDLLLTNRELERSNSELQQFAYVASHDLQEPLRKIMTFSDRLQQHFGGQLPEKGKGYVEKIIDSSQRMTRLIDDLLNFSKITRESEPFKSTDLNTIIKNVLSDFETIMKEKKAKVEYEKMPVIQAIPVQMEQLFHNLISNGLKFSNKSRTPLVKITAQPFEKNQISRFPRLNANTKYQEIIVKDNGIGFSAEYADQIFIIFQRLNDKQEFPGTGIGLALCRKIVNNHNGEIFAVSKDGKGAAFHVVLPVNQ